MSAMAEVCTSLNAVQFVSKMHVMVWSEIKVSGKNNMIAIRRVQEVSNITEKEFESKHKKHNIK